MPRNSESEEPLFDPFCNWWEGPHRQAIIDSYLEGLMFPDLADADESNADKCVVGLSVMAPQGVMWQFIRDVVERLPDRDDARRLFTAGPVESFFWRYGDNWIDEIEELGRTSLKFRRVLSLVHRHFTSAKLWSRIQSVVDPNGSAN